MQSVKGGGKLNVCSDAFFFWVPFMDFKAGDWLKPFISDEFSYIFRHGGFASWHLEGNSAKRLSELKFGHTSTQIENALLQ